MIRMPDYTKVGLYEHNIEGYEKVKKQQEVNTITAIIHATGTGKSYIALQLCYDNQDKKILYLVPSNAIKEHLLETIEENPNLDLQGDFPNLEIRTYQSLINMSLEELASLEADILIVDEFQHLGAPVWGARVNTLVTTHPNSKVLGMTAYTVRDRGTSYERDMINPYQDELFSNRVVSTYDLCDAMIDGVLPKPIYKSAYTHLEKTTDAIEQRLKHLNPTSEAYQTISKLLQDVKQRLHEAKGAKEVFKTNIKKDGKYIYFCPIGALEGKNDMETIMQEVRNWIKEMGLGEEDYEFYLTTSEMGELGTKNRKAFYNDVDLAGRKVNQKLRIMFAINQYNEGTHAPGIDGVIMGRSTKSDIVFFEWVGRALSVRGNTKEEYETLKSKSVHELLELCRKREIFIKQKESKEEIIERLLAPTIIDLAGNIDFIKELENKLGERVKTRKEATNKKHTKRKRVDRLGNTSFEISMLNEDLFEIVRYMNERLTITWMDKYELAKAYYKHHKNLEIPQRFKTVNGYEEDENGIKLGAWISTQRQAYKGKGEVKITAKQIELLEEIGMRWDNIDTMEQWMKKYKLAKSYYEHHKNLKISPKFKTVNGYEEDENGIHLGMWIVKQRQAYKGKGTGKITAKQIELLEGIGIQWDNIGMKRWMEKYKLAKSYYEHHKNLEIPQKFKTVNGYEEDENGINLGTWIGIQRKTYQGKGQGKITKEQIELLEEIGMRWENIDTMEQWMEKYKLAKSYYEHHKNLEIPTKFRTVNGYEEDEKGIHLGMWIANQRQAYKGKKIGKLTKEQIELLEGIGMQWDNIAMKKWMEKYKLAKSYYEHHKNLEIPTKFKTVNGYEEDEKGTNLGMWIGTQRQAYKGAATSHITKEQIELLEEIGMRWFSDAVNDKLQAETITEKNRHRKKIEIKNRSYSLLNQYSLLKTSQAITRDFLEQLETPRKK